MDTESGNLISERIRTETPKLATPENILLIIEDQIRKQSWDGPIGIGFPAVIQNGIVRTASNIDKSWIGVDALKLFSSKMKNRLNIINDADAAGYAEMKFGAGKKIKGTVILITIGTGIGTAVFKNGILLPNTELGHMYLDNGIKAEYFASDAVRKFEGLKSKYWAKRINHFLIALEYLFWPDLFIIGGGASKKFDKLEEHLKTRTKIVPARLLNEAGIIGAALAAKIELK